VYWQSHKVGCKKRCNPSSSCLRVTGVSSNKEYRWYLIRRRSLDEEQLEYRARKRSPGKKGRVVMKMLLLLKKLSETGCVRATD
jgi:hypothetical protein